MTDSQQPLWLKWAREIQALGQTGISYSDNDYHTQRYERLIEIAAEIVHSCTGLPQKHIHREFTMQAGYATPKVDVRGAVVRDGKILLVQEKVDRLWCLPGGWADVGDYPSEMVVREVWEESGFRVKPEKIIGVYDANRSATPMEYFHAYKLLFLCKIVGGQPRPSYETLAVDFFSFDDLPALSSTRTDERHLAEVLAHIREPQRPAAFD